MVNLADWTTMSSKNLERRLSEHWVQKLAAMSLEQVQALLEELSDRMPAPMAKILRQEYEVKLLMAMLPTLQRPLALVLTTATSDPSGTKTHCSLSDELAIVLERNRVTESTLGDVARSCNPIGLKVFQRAVRKFKTSSGFQAIDLSTDELFQVIDQVEDNGDGNETQQAADAFTEDFSPDDTEWLRNHLRDAYGLTSAKDWAFLKQARHCIKTENRELMMKQGRKAARKLSKMAFELYEQAKANDCSPVEWLEWQETKRAIRRGKVFRGSIINAPGGRQVWGDGEPVRYDREGKPRRTAIDIFGREVASTDETDVHEIDRMMKRAYLEKDDE